RVEGNKVIYDLDEMPKHNVRGFDQRTVMKNFNTAASDFGMCKALSVSWIKRNFKSEGFWEEWLTSDNSGTRQSAQSSVSLMSQDEVVDISTVVQYQNLPKTEGSDQQFNQLVQLKKNWHTRYLSSQGIILTEFVPARAVDVAEIGRKFMQLHGYGLFYLLNDGGTGHCMALYSGGAPPNKSFFFDPNFGELEQGHGFRALYEIVQPVVSDYAVLFFLAKVGLMTRYKIEKAAVKI
ncbi:MAG: YopT-type cysteine protease domain-containing protein, partial [Acetobacteraceae bacterium]